MSVSKRAQATLELSCPLNSLLLGNVHKFEHPLYNPDGALNLGVAHNDLLTQKIYEKVRECLEIIPYDVNYGSPQGSRRLRAAMFNFFDKHFKPHYPLQANDIFAQTGAGASVNQLYQIIADEGDYCIIPAPYYGAFDFDVSVNTGVKIIKVYPHNLTDITVDGEELERVYQQATNEGKRITSILITNPDNPLGRCYTRRDLETFLIFASNHQLHITFDEIYGLSSFSHLLNESKEDAFVSALAMNYKDFIDPALVHIIYGLSKDFSINGFRVGFIIDQFNDTLKAALHRSAAFSYISTIMDRLLCNLFGDEEWIDDYLDSNRKALAESYQLTTDFFTEHNIDYIPTEAGPFLMIDLRSSFKRSHGQELTREDEQTLWHNMMQHGVYIAPGSVFHLETPGLYRVTFALPWEILEKGLNMIVDSLDF